MPFNPLEGVARNRRGEGYDSSSLALNSSLDSNEGYKETEATTVNLVEIEF